MTLFISELIHISVSIIIGYLVGRSMKQIPYALVAAVVGGVLIDVDHLYDYWYAYGFDFDLMTFFAGTHFHINNKIFVPFHAWEWVLLLGIDTLVLWLVRKQIKQYWQLMTLLVAFTLGVYGHLVVDTITNDMTFAGYSIWYRLIHDFHIDALIDQNTL